MNRSKVEEQRRIYRLLKGNFTWFLRPFDPFRTWDWWPRSHGDRGPSHGGDRGLNFAINQPRSRGDRATITQRSDHDRTAIVSHDHESCLVAAVRWRSRGRSWLRIWCRSDAPKSSTPSPCFARPMEIGRSRCVHAVPPIAKDRDRPHNASDRTRSLPSDETTSDEAMMKSWRRLDAPGTSTCHQVSPLIAFTYALFPARGYLMIAWTPVRAIFAVLTASNACRVATSPAKEKRVGT